MHSIDPAEHGGTEASQHIGRHREAQVNIPYGNRDKEIPATIHVHGLLAIASGVEQPFGPETTGARYLVRAGISFTAPEGIPDLAPGRHHAVTAHFLRPDDPAALDAYFRRLGQFSSEKSGYENAVHDIFAQHLAATGRSEMNEDDFLKFRLQGTPQPPEFPHPLRSDHLYTTPDGNTSPAAIDPDSPPGKIIATSQNHPYIGIGQAAALLRLSPSPVGETELPGAINWLLANP